MPSGPGQLTSMGTDTKYRLVLRRSTLDPSGLVPRLAIHVLPTLSAGTNSTSRTRLGACCENYYCTDGQSKEYRSRVAYCRLKNTKTKRPKLISPGIQGKSNEDQSLRGSQDRN